MRNYETKVYDYIDKITGIHVVKAITRYANEPVVAIAKCDPNDKFDLEFGKTVALNRLDKKIAKKRQASMKVWVRRCKKYLSYLEAEKRRIKKALEYAEVAVADREVELKRLDELEEQLVILSSKYEG